jgi:hypothetical protein
MYEDLRTPWGAEVAMIDAKIVPFSAGFAVNRLPVFWR